MPARFQERHDLVAEGVALVHQHDGARVAGVQFVDALFEFAEGDVQGAADMPLLAHVGLPRAQVHDLRGGPDHEFLQLGGVEGALVAGPQAGGQGPELEAHGGEEQQEADAGGQGPGGQALEEREAPATWFHAQERDP